jgi:hypothetical protein
VDVEVDLVLLVDRRAERLEGLDDGEGGADGAFGVVLMRGGQAEDAHRRIAAELLDGPAVVADLPSRDLEKAADHPTQDLGIQLFAQPGRPGQVGEDCREHPPLGGIHPSRQGRATGRAESSSTWDGLLAVWAERLSHGPDCKGVPPSGGG